MISETEHTNSKSVTDRYRDRQTERERERDRSIEADKK